MEISAPTISIFFVSKVLALAPYSVQKNAKGIYIVHKSIPFLVYASSITLVMVFMTYRGLLFDANSKIPLKDAGYIILFNTAGVILTILKLLCTSLSYTYSKLVANTQWRFRLWQSFRMKSVTSKAVTSLDVSVIAMAVTAGVICGIVGFKSTQELNTRLHKIDASVHGFQNLKRERLLGIILLSLPIMSISTLMFFDIWTWLSFAVNVKSQGENVDMNALWYIPFYTLYYMLTCLHITFANTALGLSRRFKSLNVMLRMSFLPASHINEPQMQDKSKITTVIPAKQNEHALQASLSKLASETYQKSEKNKTLLLKLMAENHESLGKCVNLVSSSYGMAVLFILLSCFLHLVATSYFLFIELLSKESSGFVWLQVLWITFHALRLLMVVEPCHRITSESIKTIHIVGEIERAVHDSVMAEEVKKFWQQLLVFDDRFSACGLVVVDRSLLTSIFSAIATYLVIIIQFQKSDG